MQNVAAEMNLSETAFVVPRQDGGFDLRWFTPAIEVPLCGHATLASGWVVLNELSPSKDIVRFQTKSGELSVARGTNGMLRMSLPATSTRPFHADPGFGDQLGKALSVAPPEELHFGRYLAAVWNDATVVRAIRLGDVVPLLRQASTFGLIATAGGGTAAPYDFISRFFAPDAGVPEDPVTGSAHCVLTPFWARRLGKRELKARQASARGGDILCTDEGDRVMLSGPCALYMRGEIEV
jgi:predicted PhzF superfamily epimerase YddE/YHI9